MFDSSGYFLLRAKRMTAPMMEGLFSADDAKDYFYDFSVKFQFHPYEGVVKFINARIKSRPSIEELNSYKPAIDSRKVG